MIDSHCHLTYQQLAGQIDAVLDRAALAGVDRMITIGTTATDALRAVEFSARFAQVRCAIGIHPHHAADATPDDLAMIERLEPRSEVLALGEMGLDYHYDFSPRPRQREVFLHQLDLARRRGRPVVLHCREAMNDCFDILKEFPGIPAVFHCFTGNTAEARRILDGGYLIGLTGVVTFKKSDELRRIAAFIPDDRLLLETDSPYLSPEPLRRQKVCEPALIVYTALAIADLRGVSVERIDELTSANARQFFGWP